MSYNNVEKSVLRERAGKVFESDLLQEFKDRFKDHVVDVINTEADLQEGTDCFWDGIRVDVTAAYENKDHMIPLNGSYVLKISWLGQIVLRYGLRTGNNHHMFQSPVLVIGFDLPGHLLEYYNDAIVSAIVKKGNKIMELGEDLYWEFDDAHPGFLPE